MTPQAPDKNVFQEGNYWWFWDETQTDKYGPFATEREANITLQAYAAQVLDGERWIGTLARRARTGNKTPQEYRATFGTLGHTAASQIAADRDAILAEWERDREKLAQLVDRIMTYTAGGAVRTGMELFLHLCPPVSGGYPLTIDTERALAEMLKEE